MLEKPDPAQNRFVGSDVRICRGRLRRSPSPGRRVVPHRDGDAGAQIIYGKLNSKTGINDVLGGGNASVDIGADDVGYGGMAGILIEPVEGTRFGVTYTSQVKLDFKDRPKTNNLGPVLESTLSGAAKVDVGLTIPQTVMVSGYHDLTPEIAIMGNVVWQDWSEFGKPNVEVTTTTSRNITANLDYDDTWGFALGGRWRFLPNWSWSVGGSFDTSPMKKKQRTPALPMNQQYRIGTGVQYALSDRNTLGGAYEYANLGSNDIDRSRPLAGTLQGDCKTAEIHFFNVTVGWKF